MALAEKDNLDQVKRGASALLACIAQTLSESDPTFQERLLKKLDAAYREIKDNRSGKFSGEVIHELEMISWVRSMLTGWSFTAGQETPFLAD
jgi:hypothetical protein